MSTIAVIVPVDGASPAPTAEAVERQSTAPERTLVGMPAAATLDSEWVWLLDAGVTPERDALDRLLVAGKRANALIVSKVITPEGALDQASQPVPEVHRLERVLAALEHRAVALRVARRGSLLVRRDALLAAGALKGIDHDLRWTARLLARERGVLEPASIAVRASGAVPPTSVPDALSFLAALEAKERVWFGAHLVERARAPRP